MYDKNGTFLGTEDRTYGNLPNNFKDIDLYNFIGDLATSPIIDVEAYFSKNLVTAESYQVSGTQADNLTISYTQSSQQLPTKSVMKSATTGTYTWMYSYK